MFHSDIIALAAAKEKERRKTTDFQAKLRSEGITAATLDFDLMPLAFETSGAWGPSAKKWWGSMKKLYAEKFPDSDEDIRRRRVDEFTWTANSFADHWAQRIGTALARAQGEIVERAAGTAIVTRGA